MTEQHDENKPLYGSRGIEVYLRLLKSKYSNVDVAELLRHAEMEPYQVTDEGHRFSQKQINLFHEKIVELTGNKNIAREAGRFASSPEAMGTLTGSVISLLGPLRYYELIGSFANKISKSSHYEARKLAHNKVEITVTPYPGTMEQPYQCENRMGYWEAVSSIFSLDPPVIIHPKCLFKGDDVCHYIVSWKESTAFILKKIRNISAIILAIMCITLLSRYPAVVSAITIPVSIVIVLLINWVAGTLELRDLHRTIEDLRGVSDELVDQIEINYENSLLVNEIGQILAKESHLDGLFSEVVNILQKRLNYDHGLILLLNHEKTGLRFQDGYGFTEEQLAVIRNASFPLDATDSDELFASVFFSKKPFLMNNPEEQHSSLSPRRLEFLKQLGSSGLICCPIVYEDVVLGILTVDKVTGKRQLLQRDINLLMGIASQIAARMHNVTLEAQIRQNQKMEAIGILAGGIAHDFNNILTTILGYSEIAALKLPEGDPVKDMVKEIFYAGEKAAGLTRQLLAFSRKQVLEMSVTNLNTIVDDMGKMIARLIGEDVALEITTAAKIGNIKADVGQIEQILMNLIVNARDAMPGGGKLTIETGEIYLDEMYAERHKEVEAGSYAMLTVTDTGVGMSQEVREEIFEPFFTTKDKSKGTGLGLSTVYGIVKQHHGHIFVYSEEGKGTTFKIYFPLVGELPEQRELMQAGSMPLGTETLLIVDDDPSIRKLIIDTLEPLGYSFLQASCGEEAVEIFRSAKKRIDLLLSDVIMPGMNGRDLSEILRNECHDLKVILMSGYTDNVVAHHGKLDPGITFLNKPLLPVALANKIRQVLDSDRRTG
ncbi:MAG: ATP-binding protein [Desulfobulbaceae bacterium]|nr:ATP-binding protein [Desulfobulbaceae bacterium]